MEPDGSDDEKLRPIMIGASHCWAIDRAARAAGVALDQINFWNPFENPRLPDLSDLTPEVKKRIAGRTVFSAMGGAVPAQLGLLRHPRPFDFVIPERPDLEPDKAAEILPYHAVHATVRSLAELDIVALRYTRAAIGGPFYQIETPPPVEQEALIRPHVTDDAEISSAVFRYKIWLMYTGIIRAEIITQGGIYIPHPIEAVDDRGYLLAEFHKDAVHGNDAYGALVLAQILATATPCPADDRLDALAAFTPPASRSANARPVTSPADAPHGRTTS